MEPFVWETDTERVEVPAGFETDFASVPRWPVVFTLLGERIYAAAVLHDWLYRTGQVSRREADALFYRAMRAEGIARPYALAAWLGARLVGWLTWARYRSTP